MTILFNSSVKSDHVVSGALLKTAFICSNIIDFPSSTSLVQQLKEKFGSGFQLLSVANLPQGSGKSTKQIFTVTVMYMLHSGLGTSSILGGVIMAALWRAVGQKHSPDSLIHAVRFCIDVIIMV